MRPEVSVIMANYQGGVWLLEAVASVLGQTFPNLELLVVDDASTDGSREAIGRWASQESRLRLEVLEHNQGPAATRNCGIRAARGRYIAFIDSDDVWLPNKLERMLEFMQTEKAVFAFSAFEREDEAGRALGAYGVPARVGYWDLLKTNYIGCSTAVYDTEFFGKVEMPDLRKRQDYGLWLRLLRQTEYAYGLNESLVRYRVRSGSVSANKLGTSLYTWRLYREFEGLSLASSMYCYAHQTGRALLRSRFPGLARRLGILHAVGPG